MLQSEVSVGARKAIPEESETSQITHWMIGLGSKARLGRSCEQLSTLDYCWLVLAGGREYLFTVKRKKKKTNPQEETRQT